MPTTTSSSNVLTFPARTPRRFGRPRYSSLYLLGAWLFNRAIAMPITAVTQLVVGMRSRLAGRQLRRSSQELLRALDNLIVLNARAYRGNLDVLLQEIETRRRHWQIATTDIHGAQRS